ncbi:hypothetical protein SH449x_000390 [Pirellulaceae bacterium SH449]
MNTPARIVIALMLIAIMLSGCSKTASGPVSVTETSVVRKGLADRIQFLENYVTFRRQFEKLDYDIMYQNNGGGMVPAPSDWDIRLIAVVPETDIEAWIPEGAEKKDYPSPAWLKDLPGTIERNGITEWYRKSETVVGIDRELSIVAYRNTSTPD